MPRVPTTPSEEVIAFPTDNDIHQSPLVSQLAAYQLTSAGESDPSPIGPQHRHGPKTDQDRCETQGRGGETGRPASPPTRLSGIRVGKGIGWLSGFTERSSSDGVDPHLDLSGRDTIKARFLPTSEKILSVPVLRTVSSQSNGPLTVPISLNPTDVAASAIHVAADVAMNRQTRPRVNASLADQQGLAPLSGVTACLNINKALPSIPFQLPELPFVFDPVVFGPLGWITNSDSLAFMRGGDAPSDSGDAKSSQISGLSTATISPPKRIQNSIATDKAFQPSLIPDDDSDSDATTVSSLTRVNAWLSEEDEDTSLSSGLLTSLEVASNPPKPWPSMRLLPPTSPSLPPLDFDPYGFAGDFKTYLHLKTSGDCRLSEGD
jgi:hypothetical protein